MAEDASGPTIDHWINRLLRAAIILLVAALVLVVLAIAGQITAGWAALAFCFIAAAALVPWRVHDPLLFAPSPSRALTRAATAQVAAVIAGCPDPTVLLDRAGRVVSFNAMAAELAPALRIGEPALFALRSPEIVTTLREAMAIVAVQRADYFERVPIDRWMEVVVNPIAMANEFGGTESYFLMTFHDQTPLRRVEEMRADFVANASHELRTPLAALAGFIDTLQGPARDDPKARERFLAIMHAQASRMARLIDDLLSLSRIELSVHVRPETPTDLVPIVRQVVEGLESLARERQVSVTVDLPSSPVVIPGDRDELLRMAENLIENALKYGASGGRVEVTLALATDAAGEPEARFSVRDFGPGIAPEHLPRLTERFYRVDVGESRAQGGTGLGLSLVKHIVNRHRGRLHVDSVPGQGATFTASLPIRQRTFAAKPLSQ